MGNLKRTRLSKKTDKMTQVTHMIKRLFLFLCIFFFSTLAVAQSNPYLDALPNWQKVLTNFVDDQGRVNFKGLASNPADLITFVAATQQVSPQTHPGLFASRAQTLAYHINAYNAQAMYGILDRDIPKDISGLAKQASFFRFRGILLGGKKTNLYHYENKVIRPLDEPRLHFALNCMVRDCPRLPRQAFTEANLEQMLDSVSVEFLNKDKYVLVDQNKKTVWVSKIMDFYTKDFVPSGKADDLIGYINLYRNNKIPADYRVKYKKYDWTVNQQPS